MGAINRTNSLAPRQPDKDLPWQPSATKPREVWSADVWNLYYSNIGTSSLGHSYGYSNGAEYLPYKGERDIEELVLVHAA